jgi:hypothetical protein
MGTSSNQGSPNTPSWRLARAMLAVPGIDLDRQSQELWRAASGDRGDHLYQDLGDKVLAEACRIAGSSHTPGEALRSYTECLVGSGTAGLAQDLGRRALLRAVASNSGSHGFAAELFSELAAYYASRDLPSFVGAAGRLGSIDQIMNLKTGLRNKAKDVALSISVRADAQGWRSYVKKVVDALKQGSRSQ